MDNLHHIVSKMGRFWIYWTYHKDSYMAHRRDWKTGFEGRYRRTISPSASNRNLHYSSTSSSPGEVERKNSSSGSISSSSTTTTTTTTTTTASTTATQPTGILRSYTSTSNLLQNNNNKNAAIDNDNNVNNNNNNGWASHGRSSSTTVSFTTEELRAFKARRAHLNDSASLDKENDPRQLNPSRSSPSLTSALHSAASEGSTTSLASGGSSLGSCRSGSPSSPSKLSPTHSWRASLDCLSRPGSHAPAPPGHAPSTTHSPRTITRATSLADPLHGREEVGLSSGASQEALHLPRTASISESLSRITAINDSLSRSTSVADSLCRSTSIPEPPPSAQHHAGSVSEASYQSSPVAQLVAPPAPASPTSPVPHDGPITAHPATVTEEASPKSQSSLKSSLSTSSLSNRSPISSLTLSTKGATQLAATTKASTSVVSSTSSSAPASSPPPRPLVTSPSMSAGSEPVDTTNIVVLGYGRTPYQEELDCDRLSHDYVPQFCDDSKLLAILAPGPGHKTAGHYMAGVFSLELRRDLLSTTHAAHPDLSSALGRTRNHNNNNNNNSNTSNGEAADATEAGSERAPLPADSAYFTTSESKAKMLTRLRSTTNTSATEPSPSPPPHPTDHVSLYKKKEELVHSIGRKLEILRAEREAIKEEMRLNQELGVEVTARVEARARLAEAEKYKLHVEEIDKITSLLLGLSGRLARAENALLVMVEDADPEEKRILESKRDKLSEQLEEAKKLKENIDRRAIQVSKVLNQYLTEDQYADYDHFIKMKAKLIMDSREIEDKIKLGEEQQKALKETMKI